MNLNDAIEVTEKCIDLLDQIPTDDAIHREMVVNQIRENLWQVRNTLAVYEPPMWQAPSTPPERRVTPSQDPPVTHEPPIDTPGYSWQTRVKGDTAEVTHTLKYPTTKPIEEETDVGSTERSED